MPRAAPHSHPSAPASHGPGRSARRPVLALPVSWQPARALPSRRDPRARRAGALLEHSVTRLQRASVPGTCCGESQRLGRCPVGFRRSTAAAGGLGWLGSVGRSRKSQKSRSPGPGRRGPPEPPRLEGARSRRAPLCVHASLSHAHVIVGRPCRSRVLRHGSAVGALVPGTSWGSRTAGPWVPTSGVCASHSGTIATVAARVWGVRGKEARGGGHRARTALTTLHSASPS